MPSCCKYRHARDGGSFTRHASAGGYETRISLLRDNASGQYCDAGACFHKIASHGVGRPVAKGHKGAAAVGLILHSLEQASLGHSLKLAMRWGIPGLPTNPVVGIPRPPLNNARERYLTSEEAQRLRAAVEHSRNKQLKYIVGLLIQCGCRVSELLHAEWSHLDLERRLWRIPQSKTGKARFVPLSKGAVDLIGELPRYDNCPYLIPNPKTKLPWVGIFMSWDTARKEAGLPDLRIHDLRHSAASFMAAAGIDLYTIGKVLGHANYKTTTRYAHLANDQLIAAVEAGAAKLGVDWVAKVPAT